MANTDHKRTDTVGNDIEVVKNVTGVLHLRIFVVLPEVAC